MSILIETRIERDELKVKLDELKHRLEVIADARDEDSLPYSMAFLIPRQLAHIVRSIYLEPKAVSREEILVIVNHTGRSIKTQSTKAVDVAICRLNKRICDYGLRVRNLRGVGFYFNAEDKRVIKILLSEE